ncbi:hypothetical protein HPB50_020199 [Hyalomma asiaticum]|uniref:Uncharacterized protein n=1 Tax=Hyalomma asiaticum TaxID=266040 RepID=A0ACB7TN10_HYAAI|nr:hypothetical protein HPB50_020199 [Hyalomma asiaticum]
MKSRSTGVSWRAKDTMWKVVTHFQQNELGLFSDREGGFVIVAQDDYNSRAVEDITKNFTPVKH